MGKTWLFVAITNVQGKERVVRRIIENVPDPDAATRLGQAMCSNDCRVISCVEATVQNLTHAVREFQREFNEFHHETVVQELTRFKMRHSGRRHVLEMNEKPLPVIFRQEI